MKLISFALLLSIGVGVLPAGAQVPASPRASLAFVTNNPSDYWTICRKGTEAAAKKLGISVQFVEPVDGSAATQKKDVDALVARGATGIAISPVNPANETLYLNAVAARVKLITTDSDAPASRRLCFIGTDNHAAGLQAGHLLRKALPLGGQVMLFVGSRRAQNARDREQGIRDALTGSRLQIIGVREDRADHALAVQNTMAALAKYPHLAAMVGLWSYNGPAVLSAARTVGKSGKVKIVCFDQEAETMAGIQSGEIAGTIVQQPYQFGYRSVMLLAHLTGGGTAGVPLSRRILVPTLAITRGTIGGYVRHQTILLGGS